MKSAPLKSSVYVLLTMDVEPVSPGQGVSGPSTLEAGAQAVRDYAALLGRHGFRSTFFVHPEVAQEQAGLFRELALEGHALGLHLHPVKHGRPPSPVELGGLTADRQRAVLKRAMDEYAAGLGAPPRFFRPGCFSANDETFRVLTDLGFTGGSVSIPGRIWPARYCVWSGAYPYAHRAHSAFRGACGELPFMEIPLSVDLTRVPRRHPTEGFSYYSDLRPGGVYRDDEGIERNHRDMVRRILRRMKRDDPPLKTLVIDVHNDRDFVGVSQAARHLRDLLEGVAPEIRALGWQPVAATFDDEPLMATQ